MNLICYSKNPLYICIRIKQQTSINIKYIHMRNYNLLNAVLYFISILALVILIACEFETVLGTALQVLTMLVSLLVMKLTYYDFKQMYNQLDK